jgi:hypothetical protein
MTLMFGEVCCRLVRLCVVGSPVLCATDSGLHGVSARYPWTRGGNRRDVRWVRENTTSHDT